MRINSRLLVTSALSLLVLAGCSTRVKNMVDTAETAFFGHKGLELTVEEVSDYPYAAAYVRTDKFPQVVAVLDRAVGSQRVYRTGGEEAITTQYGRILTAAGIPGMPLFTSAWSTDPLVCYAKHAARTTATECDNTWQRQVEVGNYGENDISKWQVSSRFSVGTERDYQHPDGTQLRVIEIREQGQANRQEFSNTFYAVDGRIVYAKQWVSPGIGYAVWREMKPFDGDLQ
ncbi:YjbF family lipoprotein [Pseudidiomarina sp. 1ASP75-14]|uniref:YjbF family lipoprotein n=1 Tax=Pseudidiomarina terrestris TaxID=2820060 RepID=UPI0026540C7B|nr:MULTISPECIES: YjbF family lipoprotein [unclassified Pseudidiomarina]MDN7126988.1 YjbF family lipoprotein [Pseudidiomarina sp. 1APR75-33.1]MDN7136829.1 YjbF family lipoprotein [Pseudidiomarina sp. 1ASP75-14]